MKPAAIGVLSLLLVGVFGWLLLGRESASVAPSAKTIAAENTHVSDVSRPATKIPTENVQSANVRRLREQIVSLKAELGAIVAERKSAEAELQQAERDVTALEQFIEEIKARGEDPADYTDEGLAMFQPAFQAYQNAYDKRVLAVTMEQSATEALAAAEKELANTR